MDKETEEESTDEALVMFLGRRTTTTVSIKAIDRPGVLLSSIKLVIVIHCCIIVLLRTSFIISIEAITTKLSC